MARSQKPDLKTIEPYDVSFAEIRSGDRPGSLLAVTPLRWAAVAVILLAVIFALQGGEYSTGDWIQLRREAREEQAGVDALKAALDSLQALAIRVERDPAEQERIAREEFGMIRPGEILYRLVPADSVKGEK